MQLTVGVLVAIVFSGVLMGVSLLYVLSVPAVWRAQTDTIDAPSTRTSLSVNARNFPVFAIFLGAVGIVAPIWLGLDSVVKIPDSVNTLFGSIVGVGFLCLPLMVFINAFNRPKFLVPPAFRHDSGWVHRWWRDLTGGPGVTPNRPPTHSEDTAGHVLTNEDVQQWLANGPDRIARLRSELWVGDADLLSNEDGVAVLAVSDEWWFEIAEDLGLSIDTTEESLRTITDTAAYQYHAAQVRYVPEVPSCRFRSTPLLVDHRERWDDPFAQIDAVNIQDRFLRRLKCRD